MEWRIIGREVNSYLVDISDFWRKGIKNNSVRRDMWVKSMEKNSF